MRNIFVLIVLGLLLSSCGSTKAVTELPYTDRSVKKVVLMPVMIGKIDQPTFPLIDASSFNKKTNKISAEIMDLQDSIVHKIEEKVLEAISGNLKIELTPFHLLASGDQLRQLLEKNHTQFLMIDHDHYPKIISSYPDYNPYKFNEGKVRNYMEDLNFYMSTNPDICETLDVDGLAVSFNKMNVTGASGLFGSHGNISIETYFYLYNREGKMIAKSMAVTKPIQVRGKEVEDYKKIWDQYPIIIDLMARDIIKPKKAVK